MQVNAAKGVIVCAGDYSANPEMAKELLSQITNMIGEDGQIVTSGYEGDGLKLCLLGRRPARPRPVLHGRRLLLPWR